LAKEFGVNRTSVRQVLKVLEMIGVRTQKVGDGTYLSTSAETILSEPLDFLVLLDDLSHHELFETRLILEPELAARAAERATAEDLNLLRNSISAMQNSKTTRERLNGDMAFHDAIFRASGNRVFHLLFRQIHRIILSSMTQLTNRVALEQPLMYHQKIYACIKARDPEASRQSMREHILDARSLLVRDGRTTNTSRADGSAPTIPPGNRRS
jgi:GntR family transcriptional regulator, transcriptional repressor for pyruvate dehydrogenase complex